MMDFLSLEDGALVSLRLKQLPKGRKVIFQPLESKFTSISNPSDTLAFALRNFVSLTENSQIRIHHGREAYNLKVISVEPTRGRPAAVCILNTQLEVEFQGVRQIIHTFSYIIYKSPETHLTTQSLFLSLSLSL